MDGARGGSASGSWRNQGEPARNLVAGAGGDVIDEARSWPEHRNRENQYLGDRATRIEKGLQLLAKRDLSYSLDWLGTGISASRCPETQPKSSLLGQKFALRRFQPEKKLPSNQPRPNPLSPHITFPQIS